MCRIFNRKVKGRRKTKVQYSQEEEEQEQTLSVTDDCVAVHDQLTVICGDPKV